MQMINGTPASSDFSRPQASTDPLWVGYFFTLLRNPAKSLQISVLVMMSKLFQGSDEKSLTDTELAALHSKPRLHSTELPGQSSDGKPLTRIVSERATTPLAFTADAHSPSNTRTTDKAESDGPQQQMSTRMGR